ncbi:alpha/beta fold hydrolase [Streptomyces sp. NPDC020707]|uniref:alpha/beta fold hydrolase n=1 Tax=Streptomyces sp. NPDC020707 TaxID=3365084 RepID=UPI0037A34079
MLIGARDQTPRSWTDYLDVLSLVGARYRAIAMDTVGCGTSAKPDGPHAVERFADGVGDLIEALGLARFHLVGHQTGGVVAVEGAARFQDRVAGLLLSGTSFVDDEKRDGVHGSVAHVDPAPGGTHLRARWDNRRAFCRPGEEAGAGAAGVRRRRRGVDRPRLPRQDALDRGRRDGAKGTMRGDAGDAGMRGRSPMRRSGRRLRPSDLSRTTSARPAWTA